MGIYNWQGLSGEESCLINKMLSSLRHRGPDDSGIYTDDKTVLGHTRLSIIDLANGIQPMSNEDNSLWITFNGEIFNYPELKIYLSGKGHKFKTNSDTEVVIHLYEEKKEDCLNYLNGQFAFAIRDNNNDELFLARDHTGILPLYYTLADNHNFTFASEIKALLCSSHQHSEPDNIALSQIFTFWTTLPGRTFFKNISEIPPAHYIKISKGNLLIKRYWELNFSECKKELQLNIPGIVEEARALLLDAVKIRLRADVPVGSYLSGGIDSSGITSMIRNNFNNNLRTFGLVFNEKAFNEQNFQNSVVSFLKTDHTQKLVSNAEIANNFVNMLYHTEKPLLRTAPVPLLLLSEKVRESGYKVVLSGEGADEIFGGYNIFKESFIRWFWSRNPLSEKRPLLLKKLYPYIFKDARSYFPLKEFFGYGIENPENPFFSHEIRWRNTSRIKNFFSSELSSALHNYNPLEELLTIVPEEFGKWDFFSRAQYLEITLFLSGYLLCSQGDRVAMANSVELRVPYLDKRVVEFMGKVHPSLKLRGLNEKFLLKKIFAGTVPDAVVHRAKHPFRAPVKNIFRENPDLVSEFCSKKKLNETGLFDSAKTEQLLIKASKEALFSETDNMALAGIVSSQCICLTTLKNSLPRKPLLKPNHFFDYRSKQEKVHEIFI